MDTYNYTRCYTSFVMRYILENGVISCTDMATYYIAHV